MDRTISIRTQETLMMPTWKMRGAAVLAVFVLALAGCDQNDALDDPIQTPAPPQDDVMPTPGNDMDDDPDATP
jgi:hypothetical protein